MKNFIGRFFISLFIMGCTTSKMEEKEVIVDQKPKTEKTDSLSFFLDHYEKFFATNFNISECPGAAVVIVKDSTVIYKKGFGVKEIHTTDSVDVNTVFRIASLSKGVTSVLAGNLADNNELQWRQGVKKSVNNFSLRDKAQAERLTVNHLLSHTAGLYKYTNSKLIHKGVSLKGIIANFKRNGVVAKEGTEYEYQNAAFSIVEKVMENSTGKSFETLLKERLFVPAGMKNASSSYADIKRNTNVALPHKWNHYSKKYYLTDLHQNYYNVAAAGGINASISDMAEYLKVLLGYRPDIISKESLTEIFNPMICTSQKNTYVNLWDGVTDSYYAKGWRVIDYRNRTIIYHGGNVNQYKTQLMIDPENKIAICVLFNGPNTFNGPVIPTFLNYYDFFTATTDR
ncbi:serine hydrolase domain-containing protein [uncultured Aquimarina sp.]|uniref:serine hydrolase domain-containing protein n=1 Tax=uncultured Aquimarina sp. TaxID=575652 RepID=UPI0026085E74|nr:serine hydrolase domain-containing protein [uncultured Aquimarina sp.]